MKPSVRKDDEKASPLASYTQLAQARLVEMYIYISIYQDTYALYAAECIYTFLV